MAKQTTITIETKSLLVLYSRSSIASYCPMCGASVEMIALQDTGVLSSLHRAALEQWLSSGEVHRAEAADGSSLICLNSLLGRVTNTNPADRGLARLPGTKKEST
jgi:hypothetical protein